MSNLNVIESVLRNAGEPLRVPQIIERAGDRLPTQSRTPRDVVARDLSIDIRDNDQSKFKRVETGLYCLVDGNE